jgi:hypothetical protein
VSPSSHFLGGLTTASSRSYTGLLTINCRGFSCRGCICGRGAYLRWLNADIELSAIRVRTAGVNRTRLAGWTVEAGIAALICSAGMVCPLIEANAAFVSLEAHTLPTVIASMGEGVA